MRFELSYYALEPSIRIIAPWREWAFKSREELIAFAEKHQIPVAKDKRGEAPFSVDANLLHSSSEGKVLEDPAVEPPPYVYQRTISPMEAPDKATDITIGFAKGDAVSLDGKQLSPATLLARLNELGRDNGIGRVDLVENRFVGMKSRGVYETPGGTILLAAHRAIESITLDRGAGHLKDELMPRYAELIYNGFWFSPEREMLQAADRQEPGARRRRGAPQALQGQRHRHGPRERQVALLLDASSPSRTTRAPTTRRTPRASSASTRCASGRWAPATRARGEAAMALSVSPLTPAVGAEISGVDLAALGEAEFAQIERAWHLHSALLFRGQQLGDDDLLSFSRRFGELDPPPVNEHGRQSPPGYPDVYVVSNVLDETGRPIGSLGAGEAVWHTDMSYLEMPPDASMLYALEIPRERRRHLALRHAGGVGDAAPGLEGKGGGAAHQARRHL